MASSSPKSLISTLPRLVSYLASLQLVRKLLTSHLLRSQAASPITGFSTTGPTTTSSPSIIVPAKVTDSTDSTPTSSVRLSSLRRALRRRCPGRSLRAGSSATNKFRTVNEFTPHLVWLLTHGPNDNITCKCKYCAKKTQTEVNAALGLENYRAPSAKRESSVAGSSVGGGHGSARPVKKIKLVKDSYSDDDEDLNTGFIADETRRGRELVKEKPKKDATPTYSGTYVNKERDTDLSDGALYRVGELVWVELPTPFVDLKEGTSDRITHWIAVISDRNIVSVSSKKAPQSLKPGVAPLLQNKQTFSYRCSLLALEAEVTKTEKHIQAWLACPPPNEVFDGDRIRAQESVRHAWDGKQCRRPKLEEMKGLHEAVTAFALASQIAAHIAGSFCLV